MVDEAGSIENLDKPERICIQRVGHSVPTSLEPERSVSHCSWNQPNRIHFALTFSVYLHAMFPTKLWLALLRQVRQTRLLSIQKLVD